MEPKFQTSFIPKKPIGSNPGSGINVVHSANIFSLVATILFIVTIIISGGLFVYKKVINSQISDANKSIKNAEGALQKDIIKELVDANSRIIATKNLLEKHVVVSKVLELMEELTVKRMRITELSYVNKNNKPQITFGSEVQSYNALAQQEIIFSENEYLVNPLFSKIRLSENGSIATDFTAVINPSLVSYKKKMESKPLEQ